MTGSPSSIRRPLGQQSSFDALSRTIEGLEARIEGLMSRQPASGRDMHDRAAADSASDALESVYGDGGEIVRRQRLLERERMNLQARLDARRSARPAGHAETVATVSEASLREISDALVEIRGELRRDVGEGFARELHALRDELRSFGVAASADPLPAALRSDLMRLADCIQNLSERAVPGDESSLRNDFDTLREMIEDLARESSVAALEKQWRLLADSFSHFDPDGLRQAVVEMVGRLELLQEAVRSLPRSAPAAELEEQLTVVATAVETLARQGRLDETLVEQRFGELAERLDEISRAIVLVGAKADRTPDDEILQRLESRVEGLSRQIDDLFDGDIAGELARRIEALTGQLDQIASAASVERLGERLDALAVHLERQDTADIAEHLAELSNRIDALGEGAMSEMLAERLDQLARKIDAVAAATERFEAQAAGHLDALAGRDVEGLAGHGTATLEARLSEIVRHLEQAQTAAPGSDAALHALEAQIAHLAELMMRPAGPAGEAVEVLEPRLAAIEEHLATNDEFVIEAARQAAEAVVEAYGRSTPAAGSAEAADLSVIAELAEDLRALEAVSQRTEQRNSRSFDAVHDTLLKIAERLERLDRWRDNAPALPETEALTEAGLTPERPGLPMQEAARSSSVTPAEAAAGAAVFAMSAEGANEDRTGAPRLGFLAGLGRRVMPPRREPVMEDEEAALRADVDDAPSIDPSETFEAISANEPLEPGSGAPDISRIVQKVREAQRLEARDKTSAEIEQAEFIAAARRAAQAAAAEAETLGKGKAGRKGRGLAEILKQRRRPILIAIGAVLVALMSWPLISAWRSPNLPAVASRALPRPAGHEAPAALSPAATPETPATATAHSAAPLPQVKVIEPQEPADPKVTPPAEASKAAADTAPAAKTANDASMSPTASGDAGAKAAPAPLSETADAADSGNPAASAPAAEASPDTPSGSIAGAATADPQAQAAAPVETAAAAVPPVPAEIGPDSLRTAAEKGEPAALFEIGSRYNDGRGVDTDLATAATWYKAAAERGLAPAEYRLANLYEKGTGVDRDVAAAKVWYLKAAGQGNASAMHNLAVLEAMGSGGVGADFAAAAKWFRQAADHGVKDSQFNLAILYAQGNGVPRDLAQSYKWFAIAALAGDKDAAEKRDEVAKALKPGELEAMKTAVKAWKPIPLDPAANSVPVPPEWAGTDTKTSSIDMSKAIRNIQAILDNNGFDAGKPDGIMGARTKSAIKAFQKSVGQEPTGEITDALIKELLALNAKHAGKTDKKS